MPYTWKNQTTRRYVLAALLISILSWLVFKHFYPNPNLIFDSYYYVFAAWLNDGVSVWPIGYSAFLRLVGILTHSAGTLVVLQYGFLQASLLFFFLSMRGLFGLQRRSSLVLFCFLFLNPIYLYTSNLVLSDGLFLGLSLLWLTNLLWLLYRPRPWMIATQAALLLVTFAVRHSALYYPLIACVTFVLSRLPVWQKLAGIALSFAVVGGFIFHTMHENQQRFGVHQFSPFQGWKVASNALYAYQYIPDAEAGPVPAQFKPLDSLVRRYFDAPHVLTNVLNPDPSWGSYYMFMYPSPLLLYKDKVFGRDYHFLINIQTLSRLGPLYDAYGSYIIKKYPLTYFRHFVLPNVWLYMMPYPEVYYDHTNPFTPKQDTLGVVAKKWFGDLSLSAPEASINFRTALFIRYPLFNLAIHLFFLIILGSFLSSKRYRKSDRFFNRSAWLIAVLWLVNFGFMVIASASLLRYQLFITVVEFSVATALLDWIGQLEQRKPAMRVPDRHGASTI